MAKAATKKAAPASKKAEIAVRIVVEATQDTPAYYVNHAEVVLGMHELAIWFARLPTKPSREETEEARRSGEIVVDPEFQILFPPTMLPGLISALEQTKENYEAMFGPIGKSES
jgi:hypothetical protein